MQLNNLIRSILSSLLVSAAFAQAEDPAVPTPDVPSPGPITGANITRVEPLIRREPVLPTALPDYELRTLDVSKEVVFHLGEQTFISKLPIMIYVPVHRAGRAQAVDKLVEARALLVKATAAREVTTADLGALRDLIEQSIADLRTPLVGETKSDVGPVSPPQTTRAEGVPPSTPLGAAEHTSNSRVE